jgi:hypothetical protein
MFIFAYPDKLENLAVEALCEYVANFTNVMITGRASRRDPDGIRRHHQAPCKRLLLSINKMVPEMIAMEVSVKLMRRVNMCYALLRQDENLRSACDEIAPFILKCVVHVSVSRLECIPDTSHPTLLDHYRVRNCDLVYRALPLFRGLKALKLGSANRTADVPLNVQGFRQILEEFSSLSFMQADLDVLADNCRHIRNLKINGSFNILNKVFMTFIRFKHLTVLDLSRVRHLSEVDLLMIINSLGGFITLPVERSRPRAAPSTSGELSFSINRSPFMRMLGCNLSMVYQSYPRLHRFTNLTSLAMANVLTRPLPQLSELRHLKTFTLTNSRFSLVVETLTAIGKQLKCLNLTDVSGTDFRFIGIQCRALECLHLWFNVDQYLTLPVYRTLPLSIFEKVTSLQLHLQDLVDTQYILAKIRGLRKLVMAYTFNDDEEFLEALLRRKVLKNMEELHWGSSIVVTFSQDVSTIYEFWDDGRLSVDHVRFADPA